MSEIKTELLQAILLNNLKNIQSFKSSEEEGFFGSLGATASKYETIITLNDDNSALTIGKMLALPNEVVEVYNNLSPLEKGFLYPKINIYKMNATGDYTEVRIKTHFDSEQLKFFESRKEADETLKEAKEAYSIGLKSIHVENRPERPGDVNISVKITYSFENILALLQNQIKDLINVPLDINDVNHLDYRVKLVLGWSVPNDYSSSGAISETFKKALEYSEEIYLLQIYQHNLTFNQNGSIELEIEYGAAIEGYFDSSACDILDVDSALKRGIQVASKEEIKNEGKYLDNFVYSKIQTTLDGLSKYPEYTKNFQEIEVLKGQLKEIELNPSEYQTKRGEEIGKKIGELQEINIQYSKFLRRIRYGYILKGLFEKSKVYALEVPGGFIKTYNDALFSTSTDKQEMLNNKTVRDALRSFFLMPMGKPVRVGQLSYDVKDIEKVDHKDSKEIEGSAEEQTKSIEEETNKTLKNIPTSQEIINQTTAKLFGTTLSKDSIPIYYIKLGDLFDVAASFIEKKEEYNIIFGTIEFYDYTQNRINFINIADIPISLEHFSMWFINEIVKPQLDKYYYKNFIESVIRTLVSPLFGFFFEGVKSPISAITFNSQILTSTRKLTNKNLTSADLKGCLVDKNKKEKIFYQYYMIYATVLENKDLKGDFKQDLERGIYHYKIGSSVGVLTNANFVRIDNEKLRDARRVSKNLNTTGQVLREHYNVDLSMVGNPLSVNGRLFYMDGSHLGSLGRDATESIGLGGYYLTHGIEHVFESGDWKMEVHGVFSSPRYGAYGNQVSGTTEKLQSDISSEENEKAKQSLSPSIR